MEKLRKKWLPYLKAKGKLDKFTLRRYQNDVELCKKANPNWREAIN